MSETLAIRRASWDEERMTEDGSLRIVRCTKCREEVMPPYSGEICLYVTPRWKPVCLPCANEIDSDIVDLFNLLAPARMFADGVPINAEHDLLGDLKVAAMALKRRPVGIVRQSDGSYGISAPFRDEEEHLSPVPDVDDTDKPAA